MAFHLQNTAKIVLKILKTMTPFFVLLGMRIWCPRNSDELTVLSTSYLDTDFEKQKSCSLILNSHSVGTPTEKWENFASLCDAKASQDASRIWREMSLGI